MTGCLRPDKIAYPSRREAQAVLARMPRRRRIGTNVYRCRPGCGAYHLGHRNRRPTAARRSQR